MKQINSSQFPEVYKKLGISIPELGCIMLDVSPADIPTSSKYLNPVSLAENADIFYSSKNKERWWIDGFVGTKSAHLTLLYGLLKSGQIYKPLVDDVLEDWDMKTVKIEEVSFFESPYADDPYYCIVAHIELTPKLLEGHQRLELLPHINTFAGYKPHITLAYVKKDDAIREEMISFFNKELQGRELPITGINYGGKKK